MIVNENWLVQLGIQIKNGIMINTNASVERLIKNKNDKKCLMWNNVIAGMLTHVFVRMVNTEEYCWYFSNCVCWKYKCCG